VKHELLLGAIMDEVIKVVSVINIVARDKNSHKQEM
jgi:hypothetical protein